MSLNNTAKNAMLDQLASLGTWISLHDADPGSSGANEISGGSPAYARKQVVWNAAALGSLGTDTDPQFDVPASTVAYAGIWSAATGGTFYGYADVTDEVFAAQGVYTLTAFTIPVNDS